LIIQYAASFCRYMVLADYLALTNREIDLSEDEVVELIKVGCAGWWYVRLTDHPHTEGWAPSTYLERLPPQGETFHDQQQQQHQQQQHQQQQQRVPRDVTVA